jgi:hypothetical protein
MTSPVFVAALVVLVVNDHLLKGLWPSLITGKLSDVAGLVIVAIVLSVIVGRRPAIIASAVGFAALKAVPGVNELASPLLGGTTLTDRTDLLALAALAPTYWWLGRQHLSASRETPDWKRSPIVLLPVLAAATLSTTATSCAQPEGVVALAYESDRLYAGIGERFEGPDSAISTWAISEDGGRSWREASDEPWPDATWSSEEFCDDSGTCWHTMHERHLTKCDSTGGCERVFTAAQSPASSDSDGCMGGARFSSVIVLPEGESPNVIVAMGSNGIAVADDNGTFRARAVLDDDSTEPSIWFAFIAPGLLAIVGTAVTLHIARRRQISPTPSILLCTLGGAVLALFTPITYFVTPQSTWLVMTVLSIALFVIAIVVANRTKPPPITVWNGYQ